MSKLSVVCVRQAFRFDSPGRPGRRRALPAARPTLLLLLNISNTILIITTALLFIATNMITLSIVVIIMYYKYYLLLSMITIIIDCSQLLGRNPQASLAAPAGKALRNHPV